MRKKMSVTVNGNTLVVDGERYVCDSKEQAVDLYDMMSLGGFSIKKKKKNKVDKEDMSRSDMESKVMELAKKSYRDHFAASAQDCTDFLVCLSDILLAETDSEREVAIRFYAESAYPSLEQMVFSTIEHFREENKVEEVKKILVGLNEYLPDVFEAVQRFYGVA